MRGRGWVPRAYRSSFLLVSKGVRSEGGSKLVCVCVLAAVGHPLVLLPVTPLFGLLYACDGEQPKELARVCTYPVWAWVPTVGLHSSREGFLIF